MSWTAENGTIKPVALLPLQATGAGFIMEPQTETVPQPNQRAYIKQQVQFIIHCYAALYVPDVIPLPAGQPFTHRHVRLLNELLLVNLGQCIRQLFSDFGLCLSINGNRSQSKSEILDVRSYTVRVSLECPTLHRTLYHTLTWASCDFWRHAVTIF